MTHDSLLKRTLLLACFAIVPALTGCSSNQADQEQPPALDAETQRTLESERLFALAQQSTTEGRVDEAIEYYKQAVVTQPRYWEAWFNLGALCNRQKRYAEAVEAWRVAGDLAPSDPRAYTALGLQYQDLGFLQDAGDCYARALEQDPNYLPALKKAVEVDQLNDSYSDVTLDRIRRALHQEKDPQWVNYLRIMQLKTAERVGRAGGNTGL